MKHYFRSDYRVIGKLIGANMNITTDQAIPVQISDTDDYSIANAGDFQVIAIVARNPSISLTTAAGGIYTAVTKGGSAIVAAAQVYSALTAAQKFVALTLAGTSLTDVFDGTTQTNFYFSLTTAQGAAATADLYVYGRLFQNN